ncbi:hypothetical protein BDR26DRAFT_863801 [Obelidium mucronatum]|nr:hypothetical protein BDR26DRAFT_863801 [Obelidium mucronatum]
MSPGSSPPHPRPHEEFQSSSSTQSSAHPRPMAQPVYQITPSSQTVMSTSSNSSSSSISPLFVNYTHPSRFVLPLPVPTAYPIPQHPLSLQPSSSASLGNGDASQSLPLIDQDILEAAHSLAELNTARQRHQLDVMRDVQPVERLSGRDDEDVENSGQIALDELPRSHSESPNSEMDLTDLDITQLERIAVKQHEKVMRNNDKLQEQHDALLADWRERERLRILREQSREDRQAAEAALRRESVEGGVIEPVAASAEEPSTQDEQ